MTAFNVVRTRVKPDTRKSLWSREIGGAAPGMRRATLIKTGERSYCFIGEWENRDALIAARPTMMAQLNSLRHMLEDLGGGLGLTIQSPERRSSTEVAANIEGTQRARERSRLSSARRRAIASLHFSATQRSDLSWRTHRISLETRARRLLYGRAWPV